MRLDGTDVALVPARPAAGRQSVKHDFTLRALAPGGSAGAPAVMDVLRARQVLLEVCPTSNVHTGTVPTIYDHPLKALHAHGIPVSINDDDPITSRTRTPSNELALAHTILGMSLDSLVKIQLDTLDHCFLTNRDVVTKLKERVQAFASQISQTAT